MQKYNFFLILQNFASKNASPSAYPIDDYASLLQSDGGATILSAAFSGAVACGWVFGTATYTADVSGRDAKTDQIGLQGMGTFPAVLHVSFIAAIVVSIAIYNCFKAIVSLHSLTYGVEVGSCP